MTRRCPEKGRVCLGGNTKMSQKDMRVVLLAEENTEGLVASVDPTPTLQG